MDGDEGDRPRDNAPAGGGRSDEELGAAIRQIVSSAVHSDGVIDVFGAAGLERPAGSIDALRRLTFTRSSGAARTAFRSRQP